jgi:hypothetical protein
MTLSTGVLLNITCFYHQQQLRSSVLVYSWHEHSEVLYHMLDGIAW